MSRSPPVAWKLICKRKVYGGLGVHDCCAWNNSAIGKYVWQVEQKDDVLWIKRVHCIYINEGFWWGHISPSSAIRVWKSNCKMKERSKSAYNGDQWLDDSKAYSVK